MKKSIRITEQELNKLIKKIVNEQDNDFYSQLNDADEYANDLMDDMRKHFISLFHIALEGSQLKEMITEYQNTFKEKYPQFVGIDEHNWNIDLLMDISTDFNYDDIAFYLSEYLMEVLIDETYKM